MPTTTITRKRNPRVYKRVTTYRKKRAANVASYRRKKMKFQAKRRPFVEIKHRSHRELWTTMGGDSTYNTTVDQVSNPTVNQSMYLPPDTTVVPNLPARYALTKVFPLWSFMNPVQGVTSNDMLGQTLTAKYLTAKVQFLWPKNIQLKNPRYYIVHGWVKTPCNLTPFTTPTRTGFTRKQLLDHISNHILKDFDQNDKEEFLQFKEKTNKDYVVLGYKRIRAQGRDAGGLPNTMVYNSTADSNVTHGTPPPVNMILRWTMSNRKIEYSKGTQTSPVNDVPFFYPNKSWLPFFLLYSPDAGTSLNEGAVSIDNTPGISYNDQFWFSDS